jgi:hypothetical protein
MNTWLNQDSAKKWINDQLNALTGYKEIELIPDEEQDQDNNYISFTGVLTI